VCTGIDLAVTASRASGERKYLGGLVMLLREQKVARPGAASSA